MREFINAVTLLPGLIRVVETEDMAELMQRNAVEIEASALLRTAIGVPGFGSVEDHIRLTNDRASRVEISVIARTLSPKCRRKTVFEKKTELSASLSDCGRTRAEQPPKFHVHEVLVPNRERISRGLVEGGEAILERFRSAEREVHHDAAVERPPVTVRIEGEAPHDERKAARSRR